MRISTPCRIAALALALLTARLPAQLAPEQKVTTVKDARSEVEFDLPPQWTLSRQDGELSTLRSDAHRLPRNAELRAVAQLAFNPFPQSTFSGALFYLSISRPAKLAECVAHATPSSTTSIGPETVGDIPFNKSHQDSGKICTESRDTILSAMRHGSCIRFDLVIHTFCGGEVSGARDMTPAQLEEIQKRLDAILQSVRFRRD